MVQDRSTEMQTPSREERQASQKKSERKMLLNAFASIVAAATASSGHLLEGYGAMAVMGLLGVKKYVKQYRAAMAKNKGSVAVLAE